MKFHKLLLLLLLFAAASLQGQSRVTVNLGHTGMVTDLIAHPTLPLVFSAGEDGRVQIWNTELGGLQQTIQVSNHPITRIVHHPTRNEIAAVVNSGANTSTIRVVNWETRAEVFQRELDGAPIYFGYSPAGSYLLYTLPTLRSLFFLDARRGSARSYLDDGFGIVNFVQMATSERNIMTYVPTRGELIYWQIQTGQELLRVSTVQRLNHLAVVDQRTLKRTLVGSGPDGLVVIDNVTGEVKATYPLPEIHDIVVHPESDVIYVLSQRLPSDPEPRQILAFSYRDGRLRRESYRPGGLSDAATCLAIAPDDVQGQSGLVVGDTTGSVVRHSTSSARRQTLGSPDAAMVTDVAFTDGRLHLSLGDRIVTLVSDVFESRGLTLSMSYVGETVIEVPYDSNTKIEASGSRLLIWGQGEEADGTVYRLSPPSTSPQLFYSDDDEASVRSVVSTPAGPLIVHRNGRILQLSEFSSIERFRYFALGAQTATWGAELGLVVGKTRSNSLDSSLVVIDQLTQETLQVNTDAFLTTQVALDDRQNVLYSIGLSADSGSEVSTRLLRHSGPGFAQLSVLHEVPGADTGASLRWDDRNRTVLSTISGTGLQRYVGRLAEPFEGGENLPREIAVYGRLVAATNGDGSVTLWERDSGQHLFDLFLFGESDWIAITREGAYLSSSSTVERYLQFVPAEGTRLTREDFRITLPIGM